MMAVTLIGFGAIGRSLAERAVALGGLGIASVVVRSARIADVQAQLDQLGLKARAVDAVPVGTSLALECAGHEALHAHVLPALSGGIECAVLSVGALSESGLPEKLEAAARSGNTRLTLLAGAIGGIDALAAARLAG